MGHSRPWRIPNIEASEQGGHACCNGYRTCNRRLIGEVVIDIFRGTVPELISALGNNSMLLSKTRCSTLALAFDLVECLCKSLHTGEIVSSRGIFDESVHNPLTVDFCHYHIYLTDSQLSFDLADRQHRSELPANKNGSNHIEQLISREPYLTDKA